MFIWTPLRLFFTDVGSAREFMSVLRALSPHKYPTVNPITSVMRLNAEKAKKVHARKESHLSSSGTRVQQPTEHSRTKLNTNNSNSLGSGCTSGLPSKFNQPPKRTSTPDNSHLSQSRLARRNSKTDHGEPQTTSRKIGSEPPASPGSTRRKRSASVQSSVQPVTTTQTGRRGSEKGDAYSLRKGDSGASAFSLDKWVSGTSGSSERQQRNGGRTMSVLGSASRGLLLPTPPSPARTQPPPPANTQPPPPPSTQPAPPPYNSVPVVRNEYLISYQSPPVSPVHSSSKHSSSPFPARSLTSISPRSQPQASNFSTSASSSSSSSLTSSNTYTLSSPPPVTSLVGGSLGAAFSTSSSHASDRDTDPWSGVMQCTNSKGGLVGLRNLGNTVRVECM